MQDHRYSFEVDATPQELWELFWGSRQRVREHGPVRIEILHFGDATGEGLIRHCHFPVPRYLLSGGRAKSWEWVTEVKPHESWRYDAIGKPLWSCATGWTRFEDLGDGRTRVHFRETYHVVQSDAALPARAPRAPLHLQGQRQADQSAVVRGLEALRANRAERRAQAAG